MASIRLSAYAATVDTELSTVFWAVCSDFTLDRVSTQEWNNWTIAACGMGMSLNWNEIGHQH